MSNPRQLFQPKAFEESEAQHDVGDLCLCQACISLCRADELTETDRLLWTQDLPRRTMLGVAAEAHTVEAKCQARPHPAVGSSSAIPAAACCDAPWLEIKTRKLLRASDSNYCDHAPVSCLGCFDSLGRYYGMVNQRNLASQELLTGGRLVATLRISE